MLQRRIFKPKLLMENFPACFEQGTRGLGIDTNLTPTVPPWPPKVWPLQGRQVPAAAPCVLPTSPLPWQPQLARGAPKGPRLSPTLSWRAQCLWNRRFSELWMFSLIVSLDGNPPRFCSDWCLAFLHHCLYNPVQYFLKPSGERQHLRTNHIISSQFACIFQPAWCTGKLLW